MTAPSAMRASVNRLLVCLDLQQAFAPDGPGVRAGAAGCVENCRRILDRARGWDWSIVHSHRRTGLERTVSPPVRGLEPRATEPVMTRQGLSAFSSGSLRALVEGAREVELVVIGLSFATSGLATLFSALDLGLSVVLVEDAVGPPGTEQAALQIAGPLARLVSTDRLIGQETPLRLVSSS